MLRSLPGEPSLPDPVNTGVGKHVYPSCMPKGGFFMSKNASVSKTRKLVEASIMVAIATVLSMIKLLDLPYGGSVTAGSMLPIIIISYRHGIKWGLVTGFVFGIIQQLLGINTLSYVTTWQSIVAVILLDYIVAFLVIGFGGLFRKRAPQPRALLIGTTAVCILRFLCHVISGATVWAGLSIPTNAALIYSIGYNATYMIPETVVTAVLAYYIGSVLDLSGITIAPYSKARRTGFAIQKWIGGLLVCLALIFDVRNIFSNLQNAETGDFDVTGFASVNWAMLGIVTSICIVAAIVLFNLNYNNRYEAGSDVK